MSTWNVSMCLSHHSHLIGKILKSCWNVNTSRQSVSGGSEGAKLSQPKVAPFHACMKSQQRDSLNPPRNAVATLKYVTFLSTASVSYDFPTPPAPALLLLLRLPGAKHECHSRTVPAGNFSTPPIHLHRLTEIEEIS